MGKFFKNFINNPKDQSEIEAPSSVIATNTDYQTEPVPANSILMGYLIDGYKPTDAQFKEMTHIAISFLRAADSTGEITMTNGWSNIDEITEIEGIDVIYIGTYDLSHSLGTPDDVYSVEVMSALEKAVKIIRNKGLACGVLAQSEKDVGRWSGLGFQFIPYLAECGIIKETFESKFKNLRLASKSEV